MATTAAAPSLQQEIASGIKPHRLVGVWINVADLGLGKVLSFSKTWNVVFSDSVHLVDFVEHGQRLVVLRRRKLMKWNKGLLFELATAPTATDHALPQPAAPSPLDTLPPPAAPANSKKRVLRCAAFLSHFKFQAGTEARLVHSELKEVIGTDKEIFLDSDDLQDLRHLLTFVKQAEVLVLLQTKSVLTRPWVILELYTAITHDVPIVALNVQNSYTYDYGEALDFLTHFDEDIEIVNPGAAALLLEHGVDPVDVAWRLSNVLPYIISTDFNPNGSANAIKAAIQDLKAAMSRADPVRSTISKEAWLERRTTVPRSVRRNSKPHGLGAASIATASSDAASGDEGNSIASLAEIPVTVPELPLGYLLRGADVSEIKERLLSRGSSNTALASTTRTRSKIGAHGMGGVGKTTLAAAIVHDKDIRIAFELVVWVSVGQEPNILQLQESMHEQLVKAKLPDNATTPALISAALRDASRGRTVLLVLDDVWDPKHEKPLNIIDQDNSSKMLVTTRIRGLLRQAEEVDIGVLSRDQSLELLISTAVVSPADVQVGSKGLRVAMEISELCGRLPLTLAIAGGMISDNPEGFTDEIVELMKEDYLQEQVDEDGNSMTLEERVINSSLKAITSKNKTLVLSTFRFFAVFPEDAPVPAAFFNVFASTLSGEDKKARNAVAVGSALSTLLKYNLIKGSLIMGQGVFQHDIVRDFVISKYSAVELRALQKSVVNTILAARPQDSGFPLALYSTTPPFLAYVYRFLFWHMKGALVAGEEPPREWVTFQDDIVKANLALAIGVDALSTMSQSKEAAGDLNGAAELLYAAQFLRSIKHAIRKDLLFKSSELLERADDESCFQLEYDVCLHAWMCDVNTERWMKVVERMISLGARPLETFQHKFIRALGMWASLWTKNGFFGNDVPVETLYHKIVAFDLVMGEIERVCPHHDLRKFISVACKGNMTFCFLAASHLEGWDPTSLFDHTESDLVNNWHVYDFERDHVRLKALFRMDVFLMGCNLAVVGLYYGNFEGLNVWHWKANSAYSEMTDVLRSTKDFGVIVLEIWNCIQYAVPLFVMLGKFNEAWSLLNACTITWDEDGFECIAALQQYSSLIWNAATEQGYTTLEAMEPTALILMILSSPDGTIDGADALARLPSPAEIARLEFFDPLSRKYGLGEMTSYGARAFLKLGRDDDAFELARIAVSPEQKTVKRTTLVSCFSTLGEISAKRGKLDEASGYFSQALEEAKVSRLPMLEVLAARDWKRHLLEPSGRDCSAADTVIDAACAKMEKTRAKILPAFLGTSFET